MLCHRPLLHGPAHHLIQVASSIPQRSPRFFSSASITKPLISASRASTAFSRLSITVAPFQTLRFFSQSSARMGVTVINNSGEFKEAVTKDKLVVIDFHATWCGPCRMVSPIVEKHSDTYSGADFYKIDVDEVADVAAELGIRAMPTFFFYKNGEKVDEVVGANPPAIEAAIKKHL